MAKVQSKSRKCNPVAKRYKADNRHKPAENYLDFIPVPNEQFGWDIDKDNKVTIFVENKGIFNLIAQKILGKPKVSQVHLEEMGNFIWPLLDGKRTIYEIGQMVREEFGEKAEPLYQRLAQYMRTLQSYGFIRLKENLKKDRE